MRIGVFGERNTDLDLIRYLSSTQKRPERLGSWLEVRRRGDEFNLLVLVIPAFGEWHTRHLRELRAQHPHQRIVLVTDDLEAVALRLHDVRIDALIPIGQLETELEEAMKKLSLPRVLERAAREVEEAVRLSASVRRLLTVVLRARSPCSQVQEVARATGFSVRSIRRHWNADLPNSDVKELLDWVLLIHAHEARKVSGTWTAVAELLGISPSTLRRMARRRLGCTLSQLTATSIQRHFSRYLDALILPDSTGRTG